MQAYSDLFSKVYNKLWKDYAIRIAPIIHEFYESFGGRKKCLLDLCCGTGQLSVYFLEKGYQVVGLDLSDSMLNYARRNTLPFLVTGQAQFIQGDAADFVLDETFGLVVSTFDAMNHLPNVDALKGCFHSTFKVLDDGGFFIFDLNTKAGLQNWNHINVNTDENFFLINRGIFDDSMEKAWTKITGFVRKESGLYERFDETVYNTVFQMETVKEMISDVGFNEVYFARGGDLTQAIFEPESEKKVFLVCRK